MAEILAKRFVERIERRFKKPPPNLGGAPIA
jgi:hypothetical protein